MKYLKLSMPAILTLLLAALGAACTTNEAPADASAAGPAVPAADPYSSWPHVYAHYDYMVAADGHSHAPSAAAIQRVVDAFKKHGVILDIDPVHTAIPESKVVTLVPNVAACTGADTVDLAELKQKYYVPRNEREHYAVFAHFNTCDSPEDCSRCVATAYTPGPATFGTSGIAKLSSFNSRGYDFIVSLGNLYDLGVTDMPDIVNAGAFMHELGHNLSLHHGGDDELQQKPNYVSVMNYTYEFGIGVVNGPKTITDDTVDPSDDYIVDYSDRMLPTLYEGTLQGNTQNCVSDGGPGLDETQGLVTGTDQVIVWYTASGSVSRYALGDGSPIDWDGDGVISNASTYADVSGDGFCLPLHGFDDWKQVKAFLAADSRDE